MFLQTEIMHEEKCIIRLSILSDSVNEDPVWIGPVVIKKYSFLQSISFVHFFNFFVSRIFLFKQFKRGVELFIVLNESPFCRTCRKGTYDM